MLKIAEPREPQKTTLDHVDTGHEGMILIPGGTFRMGSDRHYPEEAPVHRVTVDGFWMDRTPVTNRQFRKFVESTRYVTFAEIAPDPKDYPGALPHMLKAGSLVFFPPSAKSICATGANGGRSSSAPTGVGPLVRVARTAASTTIRSCMSPSRMSKPTPSGRAYIAPGRVDGFEEVKAQGEFWSCLKSC